MGYIECTHHIGGLDVVLVFLNLRLELVDGNLLIFDNQIDLQLLDAKPDGDELSLTPRSSGW